MADIKLEKSIPLDLLDSFEEPKTIAEKIVLEKRRRHQAYMALDYSLSAITYFDFFSSDAFKVAKNAKYFAQICNKNVTSELLLLPFFSYPSHVSNVLGDFGISQEEVEKLVASLQVKKPETFFTKQKKKLQKTLKNIKGFFVKETLALKRKIKYSHEIGRAHV